MLPGDGGEEGRQLRRMTVIVLVALISALVFGCGSDDSTDSTRASATKEKKPPGGRAIVNAIGVVGLDGLILIDTKYFVLYEFSRDRGRIPTCYGPCAKTWPPVLTTSKPGVGFGAYEKKLGRTPRRDGTTQLLYMNQPVYRYTGDKKPQEASGEGIRAFGGVWHAIPEPDY